MLTHFKKHIDQNFLKLGVESEIKFVEDIQKDEFDIVLCHVHNLAHTLFEKEILNIIRYLKMKPYRTLNKKKQAAKDVTPESKNKITKNLKRFWV